MSARLLCLIVVLSSGCTFRAPQLEGLLALARGADEVDEALAAQAWTLSWLGERTTVYPVVTEQLVVFTTPSDLQVVFDGWQVLAGAELLPRGRTARIEVLDERRTLRYLESGVLVREVACAPWAQAPADDGGVVWTQRCEGIATDNRIFVNAAGESTELRFVIHPSYPAIRLTKGSPSTP